MVVVAALCMSAPASAQFVEELRQTLDLFPDPLARSARLVGMGRLTLVGDDPHNRVTLWDFAGNPIGVADDTVSVLELRPGTSSSSSLHDIIGTGRERQDLAARDLSVGYEAWHRHEGSAYGAIGDLSSVRLDQPRDESVETRQSVTQPNVMPIATGPMPLLLPERMRYAIRLIVARSSQTDRNRFVIQNSVGDYIDQDGESAPPTDLFTPDDYSIRTLGGGVAVSYRFGEFLTAAIGGDHTGNIIKGTNEGPRHASETREERPYTTGQATLVGRASGLEWGADARQWTSSSEREWTFTISSGVGGVPLSGRGNLLDREESGRTLRARARWKEGALEVGAGFGHHRRKITIDLPKNPGDISFNAFRNVVFYRVGADTLVLPDSVIADQSEETGWDGGAGLAWHPSGQKGLVGVEYHRYHSETETRLAGTGPRRTGWDARVGLEYPLNPVLSLRGGYLYGKRDRDELTEQNEFVSNSATLGLGLTPAAASWSVQWGYGYEWLKADFGDPAGSRESRQRLAMQFIWSF